jgi:hypothetical protein
MQAESNVTIRAVIKYAADLREDAARVVIADVWAKPYAPKESYARKLASQLGPVDALAYLRGRAAQAQREARDDAEMRQRSLDAQKARQTQERAHREANRKNVSPGRRIDLAIAKLSLVASSSAAGLERGVSGGDPEHCPLSFDKKGAPTRGPRSNVDMADAWRRKARILAEEIEQAVFQATTRDVTDRAA